MRTCLLLKWYYLQQAAVPRVFNFEVLYRLQN